MSAVKAVRCDVCSKVGEVTALARTPNAAQIPVGWLQVAIGPNLPSLDFCSYRCLEEWTRIQIYSQSNSDMAIPLDCQAKSSGVFSPAPWQSGITPVPSLIPQQWSDTVFPLMRDALALADTVTNRIMVTADQLHDVSLP